MHGWHERSVLFTISENAGISNIFFLLLRSEKRKIAFNKLEKHLQNTGGFMLAIALLVIGVLSRLIYHTPNFTPILALALFGGVYLNRRYALLVPLLLMVVSDLLIGFHDIVFFTWGSILLISALGLGVRKQKNFTTILGARLVSASLFFVVTNFGVWLMKYPHTIHGLTQCYIAAIPFFRTSLFSTLAYSAVLFGVYEFLAVRLGQTRLREVWLSN